MSSYSGAALPPRSYSFPPIIGQAPHTLILGTMPGLKSIAAGQYYAHPQNIFWKIMGDIYGAGPEKPYNERIDILTSHGIAVWDVVHSCRRAGSLDADIRQAIPNDFASFFKNHPTIRRVIFDSGKAEQIYLRMVLPNLSLPLHYLRVPSPSPAHARLPYPEKRAIWTSVLTAPL